MADVAFAGAGEAAFTGAALLRSLGHGATIWAPPNAGQGLDAVLAGSPITISGALEGTYDVRGVRDPAALAASADVIYLAVSAYYQKAVIEALAPHLEDRHLVLCFGANLGGGALYLDRLLADAGRKTRIAVMNGPMIGGRRTSDTECVTAPYRKSVLLNGLPGSDTASIVADLEAIYGRRFRTLGSGNALEVALTALNGVVHVVKALTNITRIEEGLPWCDYRYTTESVSNLTEAADEDRIAVGRAYGFELTGAVRWFDPSGRAKTVQEAMQPIRLHRTFKPGPTNIETRYLEEELPYSFYVVEQLGRKAGVATPMITNLINLLNATRRRDYRKMHDMAAATGLDELDVEGTLALWRDGFRGAAA